MSLKDVKPGTYRARAVKGAWAQVGEKATPGVGIMFEFSNGDQKETIWHVMYLTQTMCKNGLTVLENTMNTLIVTLGYNEDKPLLKDADGNQVFDKSFLADKEVDIVIELEPSQDGKQVYHRVRWVNEIGGNQLAGVSVEKVLGNLNIKAAAAAARARMGAQKASAPAQGTLSTEDVPF